MSSLFDRAEEILSTKHKMSEGYQYAVLVLVAASEEEAAKQKEKGLENEYTDSHK